MAGRIGESGRVMALNFGVVLSEGFASFGAYSLRLARLGLGLGLRRWDLGFVSLRFASRGEGGCEVVCVVSGGEAG